MLEVNNQGTFHVCSINASNSLPFSNLDPEKEIKKLQTYTLSDVKQHYTV